MSLSACSAPQSPLGDPTLPYPPETPVEVGEILHLPTGIRVSQQDMLRLATEFRVIFVGETHDNPAAHRLQLDLLKALQKKYPGRVALAMEMFTPAQQPALDKWAAGGSSEKEFLRESDWYSSWRMNYALYQPLLEFARQERIRVLGINAEKALVKVVGRTSPDELSAEDRGKLPVMDFSDPYQQALVRSTFEGHSHGGPEIDGFLRVQTLWDETMAENIAAFLKDPQNADTHLLVMAGGNHIRYGFGIPRRVFRRIPVNYVLVGSKEIVIPEELQDRFMDVEPPAYPMVPYDFLLYTEYEIAPEEPPKIGVLLDEADHRVTIRKVLPGSPGEEAGLQDQDVIVSLDGEPVEELFDVIYAVHQKQWGGRIQVEIEREGRAETVEVHFPEEGSFHGR